MAPSVAANSELMLVALLTRSRKLAHRAWPIVWLPERAVISAALRPLAENMEIKVERVEVGIGIWALAELRLAVLASLRPNCTVHVGPPSCVNTML